MELPLPARKLAKSTARSRRRSRMLVSFVLLPIILVVPSVLGYMMLPNPGSGLGLTTQQAPCDEATASDLERRFLINLRVSNTFTYANARMLDIAWDIIVGQGGRLLQGWILYKMVLAPSITRLMERHAVPYLLYTDLFFEPTSLQSVVSLCRSIIKFRSIRSILTMAWFLYAIVYVLAFSTIWNAATGYLNPTTRMYLMPDNTLVSLDQLDLLSFCFSINDARLESKVPPVIKSPNLAELLYKKDRFSHPPTANISSSNNTDAFPSQMAILTNSSLLPTAFQDMMNYADTGLQLQVLIDSARYAEAGPYLDAKPLESTSTATPSAFNSTFDLVHYRNPNPGIEAPNVQNRRIYAWNYLHDMTSLEIDLYGLNFPKAWSANLPPGLGHPDNFDFALPPDGSPLRPGVIPYNSTLTFNATRTPLSSPFVDVGSGCHRLQGALGSPCLCYRDMPIAYPIDDDKMVCAAQQGYIWGFSSTILLAGLWLESIWLIGCWLFWLDAHANSTVAALGRNGGGSIRTAFDLVDGARARLGPDASTYTNRELRCALEKCGAVRYEWNNDAVETRVYLAERELSSSWITRKAKGYEEIEKQKQRRDREDLYRWA